MQSSRELQGEIRKHSKVNNEKKKKKKRKTIEWETRELFKKTGDIEETFPVKNGHNKAQKWQGPNRSR